MTLLKFSKFLSVDYSEISYGILQLLHNESARSMRRGRFEER